MKRIGVIKRIAIGALAAILVLNPALPVLATDADDAAITQNETLLSEEEKEINTEEVTEEEETETEEETTEEEETEKTEETEEDTTETPEEHDITLEADTLEGTIPEKLTGLVGTKSLAKAPKAVEADNGKAVSIEITSIGAIGTDGSQVEVQTAIYTADGSVPKDIAYNYEIWIYSSSSSPNKTKLTSEDNTLTKKINISNGKEYDIYAKLVDLSGNEIAESAHTTIRAVKPTINKSAVEVTASADTVATGVIRVAGLSKIGYYPYGTSDEVIVDGDMISGLAQGDYYVFSPAYQDGNTYYIRSSAQKSTVPGGGVIPEEKYIVSTSGDANVSFNKSETEVKKNASLSLYIKPVNKDTHYIDTDSIAIEPAENVSDHTYNSSTGELFIENITGNITVSANSAEKQTAAAIEVESVEFNNDGIYSEENPSIQTKISVKVTDRHGNPVPKSRVAFKSDESEVSAGQYRNTDKSGIAVFTYSFSLNRENGETIADYMPVFAIDGDYTGITAYTEVHLVLQLKSDLVLYTDQIIGTKPGENDGKVINVPDNYEIWTGVVHQGAIVKGEGEWISPVNGKFTDLSAGQHVLRAGARVDESDNTYYFASDYADFFIPRGVWNISVDAEASEHVIYTGETIQTAEPGGTVYIYTEPEDGYEISEYSVDKPSYLSGGLYYSSKYDYIILDGISGNIVLTVKAVAVSAQDDDHDTQDDVQNDDQIVQNTAKDSDSQDIEVSERQNLIDTGSDSSDDSSTDIGADDDDDDDEAYVQGTEATIAASAIAALPVPLITYANSALTVPSTLPAAVQQAAAEEDIVAAVKSATPVKGSADSVPIPEVIRDTINGIEENAVPLAGNIDNSDNTTHNKAVIAINTLLLLLLSAGILYAIYRYNKRDENN